MDNLSTRRAPSWFARWAAFTLALCALCGLHAPAHAQDPIPGSLHTSPFPGFASGNGKIANLAIGAGHDYAQTVAVQADGKVVIAGHCQVVGGSDFCIARLNTDGTPDTSFIGPNNSVTGSFLLSIGISTDNAYSITLQPDGKIVLAGQCYDESNFDFCVARLNANGTLDASFVGPGGSGNGKFLLPIWSGDDTVRATVLQPDGKIVIVGQCGNSGETMVAFCVVRLNRNGTLDASFVGPGASGPTQFLLQIAPAGFDSGYSVALQADGKTVLAGSCYNGSNADFCAARLNVDGTLDTSFDGPSGTGNGKFMLPVGLGDDSVRAIALQPDGKILLAGTCSNGSNVDFCIARLNPGGSLDASFDGPSGAANGSFLLPIGTDNDSLFAMALQADGKIVLSGNCNNGSNNDFCLARLHGDGSLDSTFDGPSGTGNGKFLLPIGTGDDQLRAAAQQADGKIVVAGYCSNSGNYDFCVARLNGGPYGANDCSLDVDGDGKVVATTDLLIATRIALGMTGNAVLGGISFASHAARKTWTEIRNYLVTQCGMAVAQ